MKYACRCGLNLALLASLLGWCPEIRRMLQVFVLVGPGMREPYAQITMKARRNS
jgi:hypothetical protein